MPASVEAIELKLMVVWGLVNLVVVLMLLTGSWTYLKKFQLINSIIIDMILARKV